MSNVQQLLEDKPTMKLAGLIALLKDIQKPKKIASRLLRGDEQEERPKTTLLKCVLYGEAILIVSRDLSEECTIHFIGSLMRVQTTLLRLSIPLRGGLSRKLMTADFKDNTFLGAGLFEARSICKSLLFYGIAERSEDQRIEAIDDYRRIASDEVPLYFPKFAPTTAGSTLLLIINISMVTKSLKQTEELFINLNAPVNEEEAKLLSNTFSIFKAAYTFTFPNK